MINTFIIGFTKSGIKNGMILLCIIKLIKLFDNCGFNKKIKGERKRRKSKALNKCINIMTNL